MKHENKMESTENYIYQQQSFGPETAHYLGTVQIQYTPSTYNTAVNRYYRYIKNRFKWCNRIIFVVIFLEVLLFIPQWLNSYHEVKLTGINVLTLLVTLSYLWVMFLLIVRRIKDFKQKTAHVAFTESAKYAFYKEGIVFYESHQQGILRWDDFYHIDYQEDYLWLFLHLPKSFSREETKELSDIFIPASVIKAQPELDRFFRETLHSMDYLSAPFNSDSK